MTVASTTNRKTYTGDNVSTSFATSPVIFYATSDLQVRVTVIATGVSTLLTLNTHYTVSGGSAAGATGTVSLAGGSSPHGALLSTEKLVILRVLPLTQASDFVNNNNSDAEVLEAALDKLTDVDQQIQEQADRAIRFASGDVSGTTTELPDVMTRAGRLLGFDTLGVLTTFVLQVGTSLVDLAAAAGSSLIGFIQTGTGAVIRTVLSRLLDRVNVTDFMTAAQVADVRAGTMLIDVTSAIQAALTAHLNVYFEAGGTAAYKVTAALSCRTGHNLRGGGSTLQQFTNNTELFNIEGKSDIRIRDFNFVGKGTDYAGNDSSRAVAIFGGTSGSNITVTDDKFTNFTYTPLRTVGATNVLFSRNTVIGPGSSVATGYCYGVIFDSGTTNGIISDNFITAVGQGIRVEICTNTQITGNVIYDVAGQHGVYSGSGMTNTTISNNVISNMPLCGIKHQAADAAGKDNVGVTITGNTILTCGDQGILLLNGNPGTGGTYKVRGATISGNFVRGCGSSGINISSTFGAAVTGNVIDTCTASGINLDGSTEIVIDANTIRKTVLSGIRDQNACTKILISNNQIVDCASAATAGDRDGILLQDGTDYTLDGNVIRDANAKMEYGIIILAGTLTGTVVRDNVVRNATGTGARFPASTTLLSYRGNNFNGTGGAVTNDPLTPAVTAVAALTLPQDADVVTVNGNTNITSVSAIGMSNRRVTLIFTGTPTFTDGSNLKLSANLVATADDAITIVCDGTNWYETGRSVN